MGKGCGQNDSGKQDKVAASCVGRLRVHLSDGSELSPPKGDDNNLDRLKREFNSVPRSGLHLLGQGEP